LTGLEIAEAIHARNRVAPIMMISGSAEAPDERRAEQAGLVFLRKPFAFAQSDSVLIGCREAWPSTLVPLA
jgi:CheY-like chemotaxis protein